MRAPLYILLLALLLPAPLLVTARRWRGYGGFRYSAVRLGKIVTAVTLGHSLTLAAGTLGWVRVPTQPIEILIAVSIFVSALHAFRPIFPGREAWIAAGFGLVHGLAFATVLAGFNLSAGRTALALFAFNLGIEVMQIAVVLVTVPWLVLLSSTRFYSPVRIIGAIFAGVAALCWVAERAFAWPNPLNPVVATLAAHAVFVVAALATAALIAKFSSRRTPAAQN